LGVLKKNIFIFLSGFTLKFALSFKIYHLYLEPTL